MAETSEVSCLPSSSDLCPPTEARGSARLSVRWCLCSASCPNAMTSAGNPNQCCHFCRYPHDFDIRYDLQKKIGQGSFGTVHVAVDKRKKEK